MPVVSVNLVLDDDTYSKVCSGIYELYGLVKDVDSKKIRKHLPTIQDSIKESATKAIDIVRNHNKQFLIVGGILIIGGVAVGAVSYAKGKDQRKIVKNFGKALNEYLKSAQNGNLNVNNIDDLLKRLEELSQISVDGKLPVNLTAEEFFNLIKSIYDYTKEFAVANGKNYKNLNIPHKSGEKAIIDFQNYLNIQKDIIENAS